MGLRFFFILITMLWAALSCEHGDAQAKTAPTASKSFADAPETFSFNEWAHLEKKIKSSFDKLFKTKLVRAIVQ